MKTHKTLESQLYRAGWICLAAGIAGVYIYMRFVFPVSGTQGCMWERLLGVYCPGCGGTRALLALLRGHPLLSLWYHPLVLYGVVIYGAFMISQAFARITGFRYTKGLRFHNWYLYGAVAVILINCIVKNILRFKWNILL